MKWLTVSQTLEKQVYKLHNVPSRRLREHIDHCSSDMNTCLLTSTKFLCNPLSEKSTVLESKQGLTGWDYLYSYVFFLPQWPDTVPQASFSSSGHTVYFSPLSCNELLLLQHVLFWALMSVIWWLLSHRLRSAHSFFTHLLKQSQTERQADPFLFLYYIYS